MKGRNPAESISVILPRPDCNYRLDSYQFNRWRLSFLFAAVVGL